MKLIPKPHDDETYGEPRWKCNVNSKTTRGKIRRKCIIVKGTPMSKPPDGTRLVMRTSTNTKHHQT